MFGFASVSLLILASTTSAYKPCPYLGPAFEIPTKLSTASRFQNALQGLEKALDTAAKSSSTAFGTWPASNNSCSVGIFDTSDIQLFSYEYSAPELAQAGQGVKTVTEDSVYRLGSLSKLITAYVFMIEAGPAYWGRAVTDFIPELRDAASNCSAREDPIDCIAWHQVTLGAMASHMAGLPRDFSTPTDLLGPLALGAETALELGFPPLPQSALPSCLTSFDNPCTDEQFYKGVAGRHPTHSPFTSPGYTDTGYVLLALALEKITGRSFPDMLQKSLFDRVDMSNSSYLAPENLNSSVLPFGGLGSGFLAEEGNLTPAGGIFSTQNDLARMGQSLLASSLLSKTVTKQWMKPVTFTTDPDLAVGKPWEIWRDTGLTDHNLELYTKSGDVFSYSSLLVLAPDYNVGFVILAAGNDTTKLAELIGDTISASIFPALEQTAREQSIIKYAGTYDSQISGVNSSITVVATAGEPGLQIMAWTSNGTDFLQSLALVTAHALPIDVRLYPIGLEQQASIGAQRVAFRAAFESIATTKPDGGVFSSDCNTFFTLDSPMFGEVALDEFEFVVEGGKAVSLSPRALRISLARSA